MNLSFLALASFSATAFSTLQKTNSDPSVYDALRKPVNANRGLIYSQTLYFLQIFIYL